MNQYLIELNTFTNQINKNQTEIIVINEHQRKVIQGEHLNSLRVK